MNTTQPIETELIVTRDAQLDTDYQRKQARKALYKAFKRDMANLYDLAVEKATKGWIELSTPIKLDYFDHVYGTSLRAQYFSGRRTQKILQAKRAYGLVHG